MKVRVEPREAAPASETRPVDIWTRSTLVFLRLRTELMRKFRVSHEGRSRVAQSGCTSCLKKKPPRKTSILWSERTLLHHLHHLQLCFQAGAPV